MKKILLGLLCIIISSFLFVLSFPNPLFKQGASLLAFISVMPIFITIQSVKLKWNILFGGLFGIILFGFLNYWVISYGIILYSFLLLYMFLFYAVIFSILKVLCIITPFYCYPLQAIVWVLFEFIKTQGFFGYPYGIIGYSQYNFIEFIQIASFTGIWGVSFMVIFPSILLGNLIGLRINKNNFKLKNNIIVIGGYFLVFIIFIVYGSYISNQNEDHKTIKIALVQHHDLLTINNRPSPDKTLQSLLRLSDKAINENPKLIIWPEEAFMPQINWYYRQQEIETKQLIKKLIDYLKTVKIYFLIGNLEKVVYKNSENERSIGEYNSSHLLYKGEIISTYRKTHLVPFGEYFPFEKILPKIYKWLKDHPDTNFLLKAENNELMKMEDILFSPLICFEDSFGEISREMVKKGANLLINQTNDAKPYSYISSMQHLIMAVFRTVENRRSLVRATNYGITAIISPSGRITKSIPFGKEGLLISDVPIIKNHNTLYTKTGDWLIILFIIILSMTIVIKITLFIYKKISV